MQSDAVIWCFQICKSDALKKLFKCSELSIFARYTVLESTKSYDFDHRIQKEQKCFTHCLLLNADESKGTYIAKIFKELFHCNSITHQIPMGGLQLLYSPS